MTITVNLPQATIELLEAEAAATGKDVEKLVQEAVQTKLARRKQVACQFVADKGKGSHGRLYFGEEFTTLKDRKKEIGLDLLAKMCRDLKIDPHEL